MVLVLVHVITGVWQWHRGYEDVVTALFLDRDVRFRVAVGGQYRTLIDDFHLYRLATSVLLHGDVIHLAVNSVAIVALGRIVEPMVGALRLLVWFTLGGVLASVGSHIAFVMQSDGASGGAFALFGVAFVLGLRHRGEWDSDDARVMGPFLWVFLALNLVLSFALPFIDAAGHISGLFAGIVFAVLYRREGPPGIVATVFGLWWLLLFTVSCIAGWTWVVIH